MKRGGRGSAWENRSLPRPPCRHPKHRVVVKHFSTFAQKEPLAARGWLFAKSEGAFSHRGREGLWAGGDRRQVVKTPEKGASTVAGFCSHRGKGLEQNEERLRQHPPSTSPAHAPRSVTRLILALFINVLPLKGLVFITLILRPKVVILQQLPFFLFNTRSFAVSFPLIYFLHT